MTVNERGMPLNMPKDCETPEIYTFSAEEEQERIRATMTSGVCPEGKLLAPLTLSSYLGNSLSVLASGTGTIIKKGIANCNGIYCMLKADKIITFTADGTYDIVAESNLSLQTASIHEKLRTSGNIENNLVRDGTTFQLGLATVLVTDGNAVSVTDQRLNTSLCSDGKYVCGVATAVTVDTLNFALKADKTYCDDTFTTKAEIKAGTIKTNADRLLGKVIGFPRTGVLTNNANGITVLNPGVTLANSTVSQAWKTSSIGITNPGYTVFKFSYNDPTSGDIYKDALIAIGELNGLAIAVPAGGGSGYVIVTLTDYAITLTLNMNTYLNCTIKLVGLF